MSESQTRAGNQMSPMPHMSHVCHIHHVSHIHHMSQVHHFKEQVPSFKKGYLWRPAYRLSEPSWFHQEKVVELPNNNLTH